MCPPWRAPVGYNAWMTTDPAASWRTPTEALRVVLHLEHLKGTLLTAAVVGTVLFAINQLDTVLGGQATTATYVGDAEGHQIGDSRLHPPSSTSPPPRPSPPDRHLPIRAGEAPRDTTPPTKVPTKWPRCGGDISIDRPGEQVWSGGQRLGNIS